MATDAENLIEDCFAAWNSHDVDKILSFFTDDCVYEDAAVGVVNHGKKELSTFLNNGFTDMPDFKLESKSAFVAGNWAGSEWVMTGTQAIAAFQKYRLLARDFQYGELQSPSCARAKSAETQIIGTLPQCFSNSA